MESNNKRKHIRKGGYPTPKGGWSIIARRTTDTMPKRVIRDYLEEIHDRLTADAGGAESLTAIQRIAIDRAVTLLGGIRSFEEILRINGLMTGNGDIRTDVQGSYLAWNTALARWVAVLTATGAKDPKGKTLSAKALSAFVVKELRAASVVEGDVETPAKEPESGSGSGDDIFEGAVGSDLRGERPWPVRAVGVPVVNAPTGQMVKDSDGKA